MTAGAPPSPCIRICCLDDQDVCLGCFRTLEEITGWRDKDADTQHAILARCAERRREHDARFPPFKASAPTAKP
ncbi:MAG: DUF1289 domain-containing protein [Rhodocyclaceae bacterium]